MDRHPTSRQETDQLPSDDLSAQLGASSLASFNQPEPGLTVERLTELTESQELAGFHLQSQLDHEQKLVASDWRVRRLLADQIRQFVQLEVADQPAAETEIARALISHDPAASQGLGQLVAEEINHRALARLSYETVNWRVHHLTNNQNLLRADQLLALRDELAAEVWQELALRSSHRLLVNYFAADNLISHQIQARRAFITKLLAVVNQPAEVVD